MIVDSQASRFEQLPTSVRPERTGDNPVERLAIAVVRRELAAMPASLVVQLALWPDEVAHWAREERISESLVYNMLAGRKPYARTRARLAARLGVSTPVLDHLIEARRPQPTTRLGPDAADEPAAGALPAEAWGPIDWEGPAPYPRHRDGANPVERRAARVVEVDVASMPAATVVGLAIWPETLAEWSRRERLKSSVVWATLSGSPSGPVRDALARRLGVALRDLDSLVTTARRVPVSRRARPADLAPPPAATPDADGRGTGATATGPAERGDAPERATPGVASTAADERSADARSTQPRSDPRSEPRSVPPPAPHDEGQLSLGL